MKKNYMPVFTFRTLCIMFCLMAFAFSHADAAALLWTGATSNDWNTAANWSTGAVPTLSDDVNIPATGVTYEPSVNNKVVVKNLVIATGRKLTVATAGTLTVAGNITNNGTLDASAGTIQLYNATALQTITGKITVKNLIANCPYGVTLLGDTLRVLGTYTPTAGTLTTNGLLTLASTSNGTANVAQGSGLYITGKVTVERYISKRRAWRLLTAPLSNTGTIYTNWQNNGVANGVTGVEIFRPTGGNGFDVGGVTASIRRYDEYNDYWANLGNTNGNAILGASTATKAANLAYAVFITGPFGATSTIASGSQATTLKATGQLQTGSQTFNYYAPQGHYILTGNPYASPVELTGVINSALGVARQFWIWDPNRAGTSVGGYVTFTYNGSTYVSDMPGQTLQTTVLQSGAAFFTQASSIRQAITFNESDKASAANSTNGVFFTPTPGAPGSSSMLRIALNRSINNVVTPVDGVLALYSNDYDKDTTDDAAKLYNYDENLSIKKGWFYAAIQKAPLPAAGDSMWLDIKAMKANSSYSFTFTPQDMLTNVQAYLVDNYLGTKTAVSLTQPVTIAFATGADETSYTAGRFVVVFSAAGTLATMAANIKGWFENGVAYLQWQTVAEHGVTQYYMERSADGQNFYRISAIAPRNSDKTEVYSTVDAKPLPGSSYYRTAIAGKDGTITYSNVARVNTGSVQQGVIVYPNPVAQNKPLQFTMNSMAAGQYAVQLMGISGQRVLQAKLVHNGYPANKSLVLPALAVGRYTLVLVDAAGKKWQQKIIVVNK